MRTANEGSYPDGASIKELPVPYQSTTCANDSVVTVKPNTFAVFCNGDGTVDVRFFSKKNILID